MGNPQPRDVRSNATPQNKQRNVSPCIPDSSGEWNPAGNAIHRLIQWIDIFAVSVMRFHQITMQRPFDQGRSQEVDHAKRTAATRSLADEYLSVAKCFFGQGVSSVIVGNLLADAALAHFVNLGRSNAERWIGLAADWLVNRVHTPAIAESSANAQFEKEQKDVLNMLKVRENLFAELARCGQTVPTAIRERVDSAILRMPPHVEGKEIISVEELIRWGEETKSSSVPAKTLSVTVSPQPEPMKHQEKVESITDRLIQAKVGGVKVIQSVRLILDDPGKSLNDKLYSAEKEGLIDSNDSANLLCKYFGVTDSAIRHTEWWKNNRQDKPKTLAQRRKASNVDRLKD